MRDTSAGISRIFLDSIQKVRARQNARDAGANPIVETAAALPRSFVKRHRRLHVPRADRTSIRTSREIREDLAGAVDLCRGRAQALRRCRMAHKEPLPAGPFAKS